MGESRRRRAEIEQLKRAEQDWLASLTASERTAAAVARRTHAQLVERRGLVTGCYLLAFFLNELLRVEYFVDTDLVVGWVNDGSWPGVAPHAWIELGGKKIDISLTRTEHPESQLPGDLLILDRVIRSGTAKYTYYRDVPTEAREFIARLAREGELPPDAAEAQEHEHAYILELSKTRDGIRTYFSRNPPDRSFEALAKVVR